MNDTDRFAIDRFTNDGFAVLHPPLIDVRRAVLGRSSAWRCLHWEVVARRSWERDQGDLGTVKRR